MVVGFYYPVFMICIAHQLLFRSEMTGSPQALWWRVTSTGIFLPWRELFEDLETSPQDLSPRKGKRRILFNLQSIRMLRKSLVFNYFDALFNFSELKQIELVFGESHLVLFQRNKKATQKYLFLFTSDC